MARDQFLESCSRELYVHLKPETFKNLDEMAKEADLFAEAREGVHTCVNKRQRDNRGAAQSQNKSDVSKPVKKTEIKCSICGKGHLTIKCIQHPSRMHVNSTELENGAKQDREVTLTRVARRKKCRLRMTVHRTKVEAKIMVVVEFNSVDVEGEIIHPVVEIS